MRSLLQRLGYTIYADIPGVSELVFRRSGMQTINFMQLHRAVGAELALVIELEDAVTLMINKNPLSPLSLALTNARAEGKLLPLWEASRTHRRTVSHRALFAGPRAVTGQSVSWPGLGN